MSGDRYPTICRLIFEFLPTRTGGSVIHTVELARHIHPYCGKQFLLVPRADEDTTELDKSFPFDVYRVDYCKFRWLHRLKAKKYFKWLPLAPIVVLSYGLFALPLIFRLNRKYGIDIIHAHGVFVGVIATIAGKLLRKPAVWTLHGTLESYSPRLSGKSETILVTMFEPDYVFVVDNGGPSREKFTRLVDGSKLTPVYINVDIGRMCPRPASADLLERLNLQGRFVCISVHNLEPVQGVEYAILAFKEFLQFSGYLEAVLLVIGSGSLEERLERLACELGIRDKVIFLGAVDNSLIPDYYSVCHISLAPSLYVNMNRSTVEAMACGKPVVAFACGNTADELIQHRRTGILAEVGDIKDLANSMLLLYRDPELRRKMGESAREFIVKKRSWKSRVETELGVYSKLLNPNTIE